MLMLKLMLTLMLTLTLTLTLMLKLMTKMSLTLMSMKKGLEPTVELWLEELERRCQRAAEGVAVAKHTAILYCRYTHAVVIKTPMTS